MKYEKLISHTKNEGFSFQEKDAVTWQRKVLTSKILRNMTTGKVKLLEESSVGPEMDAAVY